MSEQIQNFLDALCPDHWWILKLPLRPFSIGHKLLLLKYGNPFLDPEYKPNHLSMADLMQGVFVCSQTFSQNLDSDHDVLLPVKLAIWKWRLRDTDVIHAAHKFQAYLKQGNAEPNVRPQSSGRIPGAPFLLRLKQFLLFSGIVKTAQEALDYPFSSAVWEYCCHHESEGRCEIRNHQELEFFAWVEEEESKARLKEKEAKNA